MLHPIILFKAMQSLTNISVEYFLVFPMRFCLKILKKGKKKKKKKRFIDSMLLYEKPHALIYEHEDE